MGRVIMSGIVPQLKAPPEAAGVQLSTFQEGSKVLLNEGGTWVQFWVVKHNYQTDLNDEGRTLLRRCDPVDSCPWYGQGEASDYFVDNSLYEWLNTDYLSVFTAYEQEQIDSTGFLVVENRNGEPAQGDTWASVFLLSATEWGCNFEQKIYDGEQLFPTDTALGFLGEDPEWTRTPSVLQSRYAVMMDPSGGGVIPSSANCAIRPCFTLPANTIFNSRSKKLVES